MWAGCHLVLLPDKQWRMYNVIFFNKNNRQQAKISRIRALRVCII